MPECQVHDCRLCRGEGEGKGVSFFKIPDGKKHPELRGIAQLWLHYCGTGHTVDKFKFGRHTVVCERHFTPDCFTDDAHIRRCRVLGLTPRYTKALTPDAVPTMVSHKRVTYDPKREARATNRNQKKESRILLSIPPKQAGLLPLLPVLGTKRRPASSAPKAIRPKRPAIAVSSPSATAASGTVIDVLTCEAAVQTDPVLILPVRPPDADKAIQVPGDWEDGVHAVDQDHSYGFYMLHS